MRAVELTDYQGFDSLRMVDIPPPSPTANEVLMEVKAAGVNFAELELTHGRYHVGKQPPFIMGFEAAGIVVEAGAGVSTLAVGDQITSIVSSGGYAEYATADASAAIPIPNGISFAEAVTIPIQGLSAYTLLKFAAKLRPSDSVLIQAAAGGVGLYLVQLAKIMGAKQVIALASSKAKLDLVASLGADVAINYTSPRWTHQVREASSGKGIDVILEAASGEVGQQSYKLLAPFGRMVIFGARNIHDTLSSEQIRQLIYNNQSLAGFNFPSLRREQISESIPSLLHWIAQGRLVLFANNAFPLEEVKSAFAALSSRQTIGKVVLDPAKR